MAVADLPHTVEVAVLGRDAPAGVLERLEDDGSDRIWVLVEDLLLDLISRPERVPVGRPVVAVRVRDLVAAGDQRLELLTERRDPGGREGAEGGAVVGDLARYELCLSRVAGPLVVGPRELDR